MKIETPEEFAHELETQWAERRVLIRDTERVLDEYAQRMGQG